MLGAYRCLRCLSISQRTLRNGGQDRRQSYLHYSLAPERALPLRPHCLCGIGRTRTCVVCKSNTRLVFAFPLGHYPKVPVFPGCQVLFSVIMSLFPRLHPLYFYIPFKVGKLQIKMANRRSDHHSLA